MYSIAGLILLAVLFYFWLKHVLNNNFLKDKIYYDDTSGKRDRLLEDNARLQEENLKLQEKAEYNIALYDITRALCKSLEEERVFVVFKEQLKKYIGVSDCKFVREDIDPAEYKGKTVLPLKIDKNNAGLLIVGGIKEQDQDTFHILAQQFVLGIKRAILYQRVQAIAITDGLTQVFSRRYCLERFKEEVERSKKFKHNFSFMMIDIDYFKNYNDRYGHLVGDAILRETAATIKESIRQIDLVGRYGGEEFAVILVETAAEQSVFVAERIRKAVEDKHIKVYDEDVKVTISIGVAAFPEDARNPQDIIERADKALYRAKEAGRNKACLYGDK
jgi:diguanylate cyclase (GGDEF)-like protein